MVLVVSQKVKHRITTQLVIPPLGIHPRELKAGTQTGICIPVFTAALFTIAKWWKQPKCVSTDGWINNRQHVRAMEYYSATKMTGIRIHATTRLGPENIMLSRINQTQKNKYCIILLI